MKLMGDSQISGDAVVKNLPANAGDARDEGSIPESGRFPGVGNDNSLQYSCLENSIHRGAWWTTGHGITELDMTYHVHVCVHTHTRTHTHIKTMTTVLKTLSSNLPVQCLYPELKKVVFNLPLNRTMLQDTFIFE